MRTRMIIITAYLLAIDDKALASKLMALWALVGDSKIHQARQDEDAGARGTCPHPNNLTGTHPSSA